ncbi:MAG: PP2C family protein-serine/threonine phosphatase [Acidiferrobacteraceae bacterium]
MKYEIAFGSRTGARSSNQDRVGVVERAHTMLMVLADGLGGHEGGALAAQIAVDTVLNTFRGLKKQRIDNPPAFLAMSLSDAHKRMYQQGISQRPPIEPRTTCVACLVQDGYAYWAHIGDSRLYHLRNHAVIARTFDHTPVERLRQGGVLTEEEMPDHPDKSQLFKCLGGHEMPGISLGPETPLHFDDVVLLCSDGLWEAFDAREMALHLREAVLEEALDDLLLAAEERMDGHSDNVSAICLRWREPRALSPPLRPVLAPAEAAVPRDVRPNTPGSPRTNIEDYSVEEALSEIEKLVRRRAPKSTD